MMYGYAGDELSLAKFCLAFDQFFGRCKDTARMPTAIPMLASYQIPGRSYKAPFELLAHRDTQVRHRSLFKRMLIVLSRTSLSWKNFEKWVPWQPSSKASAESRRPSLDGIRRARPRN